MFRGIKLSALAAALAVASSAAVANQGMYASLGGGFVHVPSVSVNESGTVIGSKFKNGYRVFGAAGYKMDEFRGEFELGYNRNKVKNPTIGGVALTGSDIKMTAMTYMANMYYHFAGVSDMVVPYVGVGLGAATVKYSGTARNVPLIGTLAVNEKATRFAAQGIAGFAVNLADNVDLTVDYRYMQTAKKDGFSYKAHSGNAGVTIYFA